MTDRDTRRRLVDLSVITLSALVLAGGFLLVARTDERRRREEPPMVVIERPVAPVATPVQRPSVVRTPAQPQQVGIRARRQAPVRGLNPAPPRRVRRIVVRRRSRAS